LESSALDFVSLNTSEVVRYFLNLPRFVGNISIIVTLPFNFKV
jgi:hypothetical protein